MTSFDPTAPAPTPQPPARPDGGPQEGLIAFLKDNLEAIAVAVVMALVIKHFCVEAFKIPTESMNPTLLGERGNAQGEGDRILVDKFAYLFSSPDRWDVIVFRYPLDRSRNFIKRIAGLPGERMRISRDGDIWVRPSDAEGGTDALRIPQKPRRVREQFYRSVYPPPRVEAPIESELNTVRAKLDRWFRAGEGNPSGWSLESHGLFVFTGGGRAELENANGIRENSDADTWALRGNSGDLVRDVRIACTLRVEEPAAGSGPVPTSFRIQWRADDDYTLTLDLAGGGAAPSKAFIKRGRADVRSKDLAVVLQPGTAYDLEMEYVDGMLRIHVDGDEIAVLPDGRRFSQTREGGSEQRLTLRAEGARMRVEDLRIDRDLRYENDWTGNSRGQRDGVDVPADSYFMLGDNSRNSSDSRRWRVTTMRLKGGRTIRMEHSAVSYADDDYKMKKAVDVDGIKRTWYEDDEDDGREEVTAAPFVHRDLIVGRAFLVFWPCFPDFPGRLGLIH